MKRRAALVNGKKDNSENGNGNRYSFFIDDVERFVSEHLRKIRLDKFQLEN